MRVYIRCMRGGRGNLYDAIIAWYSRSPYVHAEFAWPLCQRRPEQWLGAQPNGGVQCRPFDYLGSQEYDLFWISVSETTYADLERSLLREIGKPYDWRAIAGMVFQSLDRKTRTATAWFCSELVIYKLAAAGVPLQRGALSTADRMTPRDVAISPVLVAAGSHLKAAL